MFKKHGVLQHGILDNIIIMALVLALLFVSYRVGQSMSPLPKEEEKIEPPTAELESRRAVASEPWIETISWSPRIFVYHNILTMEDCEHIINLGKAQVTRSQVVAGTGNSAVHNARTSSGVFMSQYINDPIMKKLAKKISEWSHLPEENGEVFYLLRYEVGQQYLPHNDYFSHDESGEKFIGKSGQRIATVLTYLASPEEGGETIFPNAEGGLLKVKANAGDAVLFWSCTPDGKEDSRSLHGGNPVIKGTKWAMTRWIRQRRF